MLMWFCIIARRLFGIFSTLYNYFIPPFIIVANDPVFVLRGGVVGVSINGIIVALIKCMLFIYLLSAWFIGHGKSIFQQS